MSQGDPQATFSRLSGSTGGEIPSDSSSVPSKQRHLEIQGRRRSVERSRRRPAWLGGAGQHLDLADGFRLFGRSGLGQPLHASLSLDTYEYPNRN